MPRRARIVAGDHVYHILNRASRDLLLFERATCYREFLHIVSESAEATAMRILAYCAMPNHWHMLVWPRAKDDLRWFVQSFSIRQSHRWHVRNDIVGRGALYQGRYKSFLVKNDRHLLTVCRYVERNPLRAGLVSTALAWPWSSAPHRARLLGIDDELLAAETPGPRLALEPLMVDLPPNWREWLDEPQTAAELARLRAHVQNGAPYGDAQWVATVGERDSERPIELAPCGRS